MFGGPNTGSVPAEQPVSLGDRHIVDAGVTCRHAALIVKKPILVSMCAKPLPGIIAPFKGKTNRNPVAFNSQ